MSAMGKSRRQAECRERLRNSPFLSGLSVSGDLRLAFGFLHMTGNRTHGSRTDIWARFTAGLERRSGEWMIVHEHQSFPTMMDGSGKSASDLKPE
jgi:ketosteroid isomerase-like protein